MTEHDASEQASDDTDAERTTPAVEGDRSVAGSEPDSVSRREVVVPLPMYKVVIVFSTLLAIFGVVAGFIVLDAATDRANAPASEIDPGLAVLGLVLIAGGGGIYAFASRFRAEGMGKSKTNDGEGEDNGR
ncbi:MAG: hypothetical protein ABEI76_01595 [Halobacteriales archaeon]